MTENHDECTTELLRTAFEHQLALTPRQHQFRTPDCPPLPRFAAARQAGWSPQEQAHVNGCAYCQQVVAMFEAADRELNSPTVIPLPNPLADAADSGDVIDARGASHDGIFEWQFAGDRRSYWLEVRTRNESLSDRPVEFELLGQDGRPAVAGPVELRPDRNGWFAGHVEFDGRDLYERLHGEFRGCSVHVARRT